MKNLVHITGSAFLIVLITFASVGFSYKVHYCHGRATETAYYPGITGKTAGCGCEKEEKSLTSAASGDKQARIQKKNCCKNQSFDQKINVVSFSPFFYKLLHSAYYILSPQLNIIAHSSIFSDHNSSGPDKIPVSPSGRKLVFMLHQLRIPFPIFDC